MRNRKEKKGAVALTAVILIVGMLLVSGVTITLLLINQTFRSRNYNDHFVSRAASRTCLEVSLFRVSFDISFTGPLSEIIGEVECYSTVSDVPGNPLQKSIEIHSTYSDLHFYDTKVVDLSTNPIQIVE